jgi:hypothetical protein
LQVGAGLGGVTGTLAGLVAIAVPGAAVVSAGAVVVATALAGSAVGAWLSSMIGVDVDSRRLKPFEQAIESGQLLMMVDVPPERVHEIESLVARAAPAARAQGVETDIPAFP